MFGGIRNAMVYFAIVHVYSFWVFSFDFIKCEYQRVIFLIRALWSLKSFIFMTSCSLSYIDWSLMVFESSVLIFNLTSVNYYLYCVFRYGISLYQGVSGTITQIFKTRSPLQTSALTLYRNWGPDISFNILSITTIFGSIAVTVSLYSKMIFIRQYFAVNWQKLMKIVAHTLLVRRPHGHVFNIWGPDIWANILL